MDSFVWPSALPSARMFYHCEGKLYPRSSPCLPPSPCPCPPLVCLFLWTCLSWTWHATCSLRDWRLRLSRLFSRFAPGVACVIPPSLFVTKQYLWYECHIRFAHSSTGRRLGCFHLWLLWLVLLWTFVAKCLLEHLFISSSGSIPESRAVGSYGNSVCSCLRDCQPFLQRPPLFTFPQ